MIKSNLTTDRFRRTDQVTDKRWHNNVTSTVGSSSFSVRASGTYWTATVRRNVCSLYTMPVLNNSRVFLKILLSLSHLAVNCRWTVAAGFCRCFESSEFESRIHSFLFTKRRGDYVGLVYAESSLPCFNRIILWLIQE